MICGAVGVAGAAQEQREERMRELISEHHRLEGGVEQVVGGLIQVGEQIATLLFVFLGSS